MPLTVGDLYRLELPGIAARIIGATGTEGHPYLVESFFLRRRWRVNDAGVPAGRAPRLLVKWKTSEIGVVVSLALIVLAVYFPLALWINSGQFQYRAAPDFSARERVSSGAFAPVNPPDRKAKQQ